MFPTRANVKIAEITRREVEIEIRIRVEFYTLNSIQLPTQS